MGEQGEEIRRLRGCIRDLEALSSLPLVWIDHAPSQVLSSFVELVHEKLTLDFTYVRTLDPDGGTLQAAKLEGVGVEDDAADAIARALGGWFAPSGVRRVHHPADQSPALAATYPLLPQEAGLVVAGSRRHDFPSELDSMLLGSAVNQLSTWLRAARALAAQKRTSTLLAERERLRSDLEAENAYLREEVEDVLAIGRIVGQSRAMKEVLAQVELVAPTQATVLLLGESGTGKELIAREIHERSRRAHRPLIKVNCSAIPREMFESEFFGHTRGAFTGAMRERQGRFELADGGTLFLDEVADLPLDLQPKLLRVLQEGQYERVGEDGTRHVDVRVVAATNRNLEVEIEAGRFREDLFYRLGVFPIELPPLRDHKEDIPALAKHFVTLVSRRLGVVEPVLRPEHCEQLGELEWRGNVRELQNVLERAVILSRGGELRLDWGLSVRSSDRRTPTLPPPPQSQTNEIVPEREWRRRENENLLAAIERAGGRIYGPGGAAALLGMKPSTLQSRLRALRLRPTHK